MELANVTLQSELQRLASLVVADRIAEISKYKELRINGINDIAGYKAVFQALQDIKQDRIKVEKMRKALKQDALDYGRAVDAKAKEIQALIEPVEEHLKAEREAIDNEKARIEQEKKTAAEIAACLDEAYAANEQFDRQKEEAARLEAQRLEQERKEAELAAKQAEIERKEREAQIAREAEERARQKAEAEIQAAKLAQEKAEREAKEATERERQRIQAEQAAKEAEARLRAEAEAKRKQQAPDKIKLSIFCDALTSVIDNAPMLTDARLAGLLGADLSIMTEIRDRLKKLSL